MKKLLCISTSALIVLSCFGDKTPTGPATDATFAIYLLNDTIMTTSQADTCELSELQLQDEPWLSVEDIEFYDYSTHCIYLKDDKSSFFNSLGSMPVVPLVAGGKPFVVVADQERCYLGTFHSMISCSMPSTPNINDGDLFRYPEDVIHIARTNITDSDVRGDTRIRDALIKAGIFHEGLRVQLQSVEVINQPDTSTVIYTFSITNNDDDDLYVPDPTLMGSKLFHYYTNGVVLENQDNHFWSEYKTTEGPDPFYSWDAEWYGRVKSKSSIQREVTLKGYPPIPTGTYSCYFTYSGPMRIERDKRILSGGRLWLGEIKSNMITVSVNQ